MSWSIEPRDGLVVVRMESSSVNKMNEAFFRDGREAIDRLAGASDPAPVVLCSGGRAFSAGLDFEEVLPLFDSDDPAPVRRFFDGFLDFYRSWFELPRPLVAAVEGPAIAGGFILACCCDLRIGAESAGRFGLNEVPLGIPIPGAFLAIVRHALGAPATTSLTLTGRLVDAAEAHRLGFFHEVVAGPRALPRAEEIARAMAPDTMPAYVRSKQALQTGALEQIERARQDDDALVRAITSEPGRRARRRARDELAARRRG